MAIELSTLQAERDVLQKDFDSLSSRIKQVDGKMEIDYTSYPPIPDDLRDLLDSEDLLEEE